MLGGRLLDDRTDTTGTYDSPDEEGDTGGRYNVSLDGEQVTNLVDGEPNGWQRAKPEDEE